MYERFTDRSRKVMNLAQIEALRLNHGYIGTEHILLGLASEGVGVAANVLKNLGIDLRKIRLEVEKIIQAGSDTVTMGRLPLTPRAKKAIEYSMEEARNLNHNYVGTEHLLLGLIREGEGVASQVLAALGVSLKGVRDEVLSMLAPNSSSKQPEREAIPFSDLTLRDYFAANAMNGLVHDALINQRCEDILMKNGLKADEFQAFLAKLAYGTADAMIAARSK